jgi:hypothetical protein
MKGDGSILPVPLGQRNSASLTEPSRRISDKAGKIKRLPNELQVHKFTLNIHIPLVPSLHILQVMHNYPWSYPRDQPPSLFRLR